MPTRERTAAHHARDGAGDVRPALPPEAAGSRAARWLYGQRPQRPLQWRVLRSVCKRLRDGVPRARMLGAFTHLSRPCQRFSEAAPSVPVDVGAPGSRKPPPCENTGFTRPSVPRVEGCTRCLQQLPGSFFRDQHLSHDHCPGTGGGSGGQPLAPPRPRQAPPRPRHGPARPRHCPATIPLQPCQAPPLPHHDPATAPPQPRQASSRPHQAPLGPAMAPPRPHYGPATAPPWPTQVGPLPQPRGWRAGCSLA